MGVFRTRSSKMKENSYILAFKKLHNRQRVRIKAMVPMKNDTCSASWEHQPNDTSASKAELQIVKIIVIFNGFSFTSNVGRLESQISSAFQLIFSVFRTTFYSHFICFGRCFISNYFFRSILLFPAQENATIWTIIIVFVSSDKKDCKQKKI